MSPTPGTFGTLGLSAENREKFDDLTFTAIFHKRK